MRKAGRKHESRNISLQYSKYASTKQRTTRLIVTTRPAGGSNAKEIGNEALTFHKFGTLVTVVVGDGILEDTSTTVIHIMRVPPLESAAMLSWTRFSKIHRTKRHNTTNEDPRS